MSLWKLSKKENPSKKIHIKREPAFIKRAGERFSRLFNDERLKRIYYGVCLSIIVDVKVNRL